MRRDLTHAPMWGRNAAHANASATIGGPARRRVRLALVAALALLGALALATPASADFVKLTSFDGSRTPAGSMTPERLAVDATTGDVYVIDTASGVVDRFNRYGKYLSQLSQPASNPNCTLGTLGFDGFEDDVAVDNSSASTQGNVYVVGEHQGGGPSIITAFDKNGNCLWQVNSPFAATPPTRIAGVAVNPTNGDLWIGDRRRGIYRLSTANGSSLGDTPFGLNGTPVGPSDEAPAHLAFDSVGNLYGSAVQGATVKYAPTGTTPPYADPPTATIDSNAAFDVATDANGNVYVDHGSGVTVYDSTGTQDPSTPFGSTTTLLHGIAVDGAANPLIYVENNDTNAIEIWAPAPGPTMDSLTVTVGGTGTGNVDADQGAIMGCGSLGGPCTDNYIDGDTVRLTETPDAGMTFAGWSGDGSSCGTATTCDVPMNAAKNVTATFTAPTHTLTVTVGGAGAGSVDSSPSGISGCTSSGGPACTHSYTEGTTVTLTPTAGAHTTFAGWIGCDSVSGDTCTVHMTADANVTATFSPIQHTLTVSNGGGGSVTSSPAGIDCGATCSSLFDEGTSVTLTAVADAGSTFAGWSGGGCSGTSTCIVSVDADTTVTATFTTPPRQHTLSVSKAGDGSGSVTSSPAGVSCGGTCSALFNDGTSVTLTAAADSGSTFAGWSGGGCSGTGTCTVALGADASVTATFRKIPSRSFLTIDGFNSKTLLLRLTCHGVAGQPACSGKLTFKAVIKVRVKKHGKTKVVKKTITVATVSYNVAAGSSGSVKLKLTSAAKTALKSGALTAKCTNPRGTIHLPKTKAKKKAKKRH